MQILKQSTAFTAIVGPILDSAGAEYTGAVIGDLSISKNGTEAAMAAAATLTHVSNGFYTLVGTTGNTDTLGRITIRCNKATYQMPPKEYTVLVAAAFDVLVTNGTIASTTNITAGTITTTTNLTNLPTIPADWLTAAGTAADFSTEIRNAITGGAYALDTDANGRMRIVDGTSVGELDTASGAVIVADKTGFRLSATGVDDIWDEVIAAATLTARTALAIAGSGGLGEFAVNDAGASTTVFITTLTSIVDNFYRDMQIQFTSGALNGQVRVIASYNGTTKAVTLDEALTSAPANLVTFVVSGPHTHTVTSISDGVWASATRVLTAATNITSTGGTTVPQTGDSFAVVNSGTFGNSALNTDLDSLLTRLTSTRAGYLDNLSVGAVALETTAQSILADTGTDGVVVNATGLATDAVQEIRNAITGGAYALSTDVNGMMRIVDGTGTGELDTSLGTVLLRSATEAQIDAIETDTNELQTDWTNGGRLDLLLDAILDDTGTSGVVLTSGERDSIAAAHLDLTSGIETGVTPRQAMRGIAAILSGIVSGAGTGTEVFKGIAQASGGTTRVTVTVDASGNRSAMTLNL